MSDEVYDIDCAHCGKTVYVNNGNIEDMTVPDVDSVICPYCGKTFCVGDDFGVGCETEGYKTPNEAFGLNG